MKRVIKFRAWVKGANVPFMASWEDLNHPKNEYPFYVEDPAMEVMQYTGLKDKNGREIFEGDIVQAPYITPFGDITEGGDNEKGRVVFVNASFMVHMYYSPEPSPLISWISKEQGEYIGNYGNLTIYSDTTILEVIGNIYENSELLST